MLNQVMRTTDFEIVQTGVWGGSDLQVIVTIGSLSGYINSEFLNGH